jgi:hypothetical protein
MTVSAACKKSLKGRGPDVARAAGVDESEKSGSPALEKTIAVVGTVNMIATAGVLAVTSLLAMEGSESMRFAVASKKLP